MAEWQKISTAEQLTSYLLSELKQGRWSGTMPGVIKLSTELGVARDSVEAAMRELERRGVLESKGPGRGRSIHLEEEEATITRGLRISILLGDDSDRYGSLTLKLLNELQNAGYAASFAAKTHEELGDNKDRIARFVNQTASDAWVVYSGSRQVLKWFADSGIPCFALAGRANRIKLPSIAPDKITPLRASIRKLVELGHRRIIMLSPRFRRIPEPGLFERAFLDELEKLGIPTGLYNLPDWDDTGEGFHKNLESLFRFTPPTALFVDRALFITPTLQFCMRQGLHVPKDFSLICTESDPSFDWAQPSIAHIHRGTRPITRRIAQWAENVLQGKEDFKKGFSQAEFVEGDTIGPSQISGQ